MKVIRALILFVASLLCAQAVYSQLERTGRPCVPQPFEANAWEWGDSWTPEQKAELEAYLDYLERDIIEQIYLRFCSHAANNLQCSIFADYIEGCIHDTLFIDHQAIEIRDRDHGGPASITFYEDSTDDSNYASITVSRAPDSLQLEESYQLVLPKGDGEVHGNRSVPGGNDLPNDAYLRWDDGNIANSELLTDGHGQLYWMDRDYIPRWMGDTLMSDTFNTSGNIKVLCEEVWFVNDSNTARGGWQGTAVPVQVRFYEPQQEGGDYWQLSANPEMTGSFSTIFPDSASPHKPAILQYDGNTDFGWGPYDEQFIIRGIDSAGGGVGHDIVYPFLTGYEIGNGSISLGENTFDQLYSWSVYFEWVRASADSFIASSINNLISTKPYGCPDIGDPRFDSLFECGSAGNFESRWQDWVTGGPGAEWHLSDSSFKVCLPSSYTSDTILVYRWKVIGFVKDYEAESTR